MAREMRGKRPELGLYRWVSDFRRKSSRLRLSAEGFDFRSLSWNRSHRILTGASTLTRIKNGRRKSLSSISSVCISVVTHLSLHRFVTKSSRSSVVLNVCSAGTVLGLMPLNWGTTCVNLWFSSSLIARGSVPL